MAKSIGAHQVRAKGVPAETKIMGAKVFAQKKITNLNKPLNKIRRSKLNTSPTFKNPNL